MLPGAQTLPWSTAWVGASTKWVKQLLLFLLCVCASFPAVKFFPVSKQSRQPSLEKIASLHAFPDLFLTAYSIVLFYLCHLLFICIYRMLQKKEGKKKSWNLLLRACVPFWMDFPDGSPPPAPLPECSWQGLDKIRQRLYSKGKVKPSMTSTKAVGQSRNAELAILLKN